MTRVNDLHYPEIESKPFSSELFAKKILYEFTSCCKENQSAKDILESDIPWRKNYDLILTEIWKSVELSSDESVYQGCKSALSYLHDKLNYEYNDRKYKLSEINESLVSKPDEFSSLIIQGNKYASYENRKYSKADYAKRYEPVLYEDDICLGKERDILNCVKSWTSKEYIEDSAEDKVKWVLNNQEKIDVNLENHIFVIFGANCEMGPMEQLMECQGIEIVLIDLPRQEIQQNLLKKAELSKAKLYFPFRNGKTGADLIADAPSLIKWLTGLQPKKRMILGNYAYADGKKFVKLSSMMDVISLRVGLNRGKKYTSFAYLMSPTDVFVTNKKVRLASERMYGSRSLLAKGVNAVLRNKLQPNFAPESQSTVINNVVQQQGPNYILAKKIQQWRSLWFLTNGWNISSNIAPATYTNSVIKNTVFRIAYGGSEFFDMKIFKSKESNSLMTLLLINDIFCEVAVSDKENSSLSQFFMDGACHGRMFRFQYKLSSAIELAALLYIANKSLLPTGVLSSIAVGGQILKSKL